MMREKLGNIFEFKSGRGLTEEIVYKHQPTSEDDRVPIYSGATEEKNSLGEISKEAEKELDEFKLFEGPAIVVIRKGLAGRMRYIQDEVFTTNDDVYVLKLSEDWEDKVNLRWFAYRFQEFFKQLTSNSDNATFNKRYSKKQTIEIPSKEKQDRIAQKLEELEDLRKKIKQEKDRLDKLKQTRIPIKEGEEEKIKNIFKFGKGETLTEEIIYKHQPTGEDDRVPIYSSATEEENLLGLVSREAEDKVEEIELFEGPALLVTRNGYAGKMSYVEDEYFTTNDHVYILSLKDKWQNKINLKWFSYEFEDFFIQLTTSKSDNATFNKTYIRDRAIQIPPKEEQDRIATKLRKIEDLITKLEDKEAEIQDLLHYKVV